MATSALNEAAKALWLTLPGSALVPWESLTTETRRELAVQAGVVVLAYQAAIFEERHGDPA